MLRSALTLVMLWGLLSYVLLSAGEGQRLRRLLKMVVAFATGGGTALLLLSYATGDTPYVLIRILASSLFIAVIAASGGALLMVENPPRWYSRIAVWSENVSPMLFPLLFGVSAITALTGSSPVWKSATVTAVVVILMACITANFVSFALTLFVHRLPLTYISRFLLCSSILLCVSSSSPRLDLFAPLSMKIMKFTHDFVHQFMESMLLPDHLFITGIAWDIVGLLFSREVGFWGALIVWFVPALLVLLVIAGTPLPAVVHVRLGARRRLMIAAALGEQRKQFVVPALAALVMIWSVYQSSFPATRYWDPAPISVEADPDGDVVLPLQQGDLSLRDGKIHKFSYEKGGSRVRFFVLYRGGTPVVVLDACAICQPEGYGQGDGAVLCYYCKTLIPEETVGLPGGCNPVPVPSKFRGETVRISALQLVNLWNSTVQSVTQNSGGR